MIFNINKLKFSVANPDPGLGIFLTPGSGIRDEQPGYNFLEVKNKFFCFFGGLNI